MTWLQRRSLIVSAAIVAIVASSAVGMKMLRVNDPPEHSALMSRRERLTLLKALVDQIDSTCSYASMGQRTYRAVALRLQGELPESQTAGSFERDLREVVAAAGDAHASIIGPKSAQGPRFAPALFYALEPENLLSPIIVVKPDRSGFIDEAHPILTAIDDIPIYHWLVAARRTVPVGSSQLRTERTLRELRDIRACAEDRGVAFGDGHVLTFTLTRADGGDPIRVEAPLSASKPIYGAWPRRESGMIEPDIAYLRLADMNETAPAEIARVIEMATAAKGLIVDVRHNGGGTRDALFALAAHIMAPGERPRVVNAARPLLVDGGIPDKVIERLADRGLKLVDDPSWSAAEKAEIAFEMKRFEQVSIPEPERFGPWHVAVISPRDGDMVRFTGPVVVLMDSVCFSATDIFLAAMKTLPNVTLVGQPSAGGSGASRGHVIGDGWGVVLSSIVSFQPGGLPLDGHGVEPHERVKPIPTDFILGGTDTALDRAISIVREK